MVTFAPGPSYIPDAVQNDIRRALDEHLLELSHRSKEFSALSKKTFDGLRTFLGIPNDYHIFYLPSSSDSWHSLATNVVHTRSFHFANGAFSKKPYTAASLLYKNAVLQEYAWGEAIDVSVPIPPDTELITACMNETSTGVAMTQDDIATLRANNPDTLLAIDVTSCAGAVPLPIALADAWYFSVQKCFGLPSGLGILIVSDRAYQKSLELEASKENLAGQWRWSELQKPIDEKDHQTPHTPNMLGIFLLGEQLERRIAQGGIDTLYNNTLAKKQALHEWLASRSDVRMFGTADTAHRSDTIVTLDGTPEALEALAQKAKTAGHTIGGGYGKLKGKALRIANFPQHSMEDVQSLLAALS
jgi:phosphoserine aminotransferase